MIHLQNRNGFGAFTSMLFEMSEIDLQLLTALYPETSRIYSRQKVYLLVYDNGNITFCSTIFLKLMIIAKILMFH